MKAFFAAILGIVVIAVGAKFGLESLEMSAREVHALPGVSLPAEEPRPAFQ